MFGRVGGRVVRWRMCTRSGIVAVPGIYGRIEKHTARVIVCRVSCVLYAVVDVFPVAGGGRVRSFTVPRCSVFVVGRNIVLHQY